MLLLTMSFTSDFSLFPIKKWGNANFSYRKATWPKEVDPEIHKIVDNITTDPIYYTRTTFHNARTQYCKVSKQGSDVIVEPGDGYNFIVRRDSNNNKLKEEIVDDNAIPHEMMCVICMANKRTHAVIECGHVSMCYVCAKLQHDTNHDCPICRVEMKSFPIKLFFS